MNVPTELADGDLPGAPDGSTIVERSIAVPGGKVFVSIVNPDAAATPLVGLHGGPGFPSYYLEPLRALAASRPVILYDQLGCGRSDRPVEKDLWTIERFADELEAVLAALGYPRYHLYGHSWGTMLATRYVTRHEGRRLGAVIMSSPALYTKWWERDCAMLIDQLGEPHGGGIRDANARGEYSGEAYEAAHDEFYRRFVCKRGMSTGLFARTVEEAGLDVYMRIQGPNEFTVIGDMKDYDFRGDLAAFTLPTLFMTGAEDEARPNTVADFATMTPNSRMTVIPDAAHLTMLDNATTHNAEVAAFLADVDRSGR